ncbi:MAG: GNAT family N-acetyltransferase [Dehalococcoidia bacterium]
MTERITIRPFEARDIEGASTVLATRHRVVRERFPMLPEAFEAPAATVEHFSFVLDIPGASGVVAERGGRMVGFWLGFPMDDGYVLPKRHALTLAPAHAVLPGEDADEAYHALYGAVAGPWVARARLLHIVHIPAGDPTTAEAFGNLGFGRTNAYAVRDLSPLASEGARPRVEIRESTPEDLEVVMRLSEAERKFHSRPPIFEPYPGEADVERVRERQRANLSAEDSTHLIASVDGREAGILTLRTPLGSPLFTPAGSVYIAETGVLRSARGTGVGTALLTRALDWAREHGHSHAALHFRRANPISPGFWMGHGFVPVLEQLERVIDDRAVWAQAEDED